MFDSKNFLNVIEDYNDGCPVFVFYDRFAKKFGPLNVAGSIQEVVYNACNYLKSVEDKNISLEHIDIYLVGNAIVENCEYNLGNPIPFFNAADYKEAYNLVLSEV